MLHEKLNEKVNNKAEKALTFTFKLFAGERKLCSSAIQILTRVFNNQV